LFAVNYRETDKWFEKFSANVGFEKLGNKCYSITANLLTNRWFSIENTVVIFPTDQGRIASLG